jgi:hypothetical protein
MNMKTTTIVALMVMAVAAEAGDLSPAPFIAEHPRLHEVGTNPEMNWMFQANGSFSAISLSSTYGFTVTGKWSIVSNSYVRIVGTSTNTRTGVEQGIDTTITNIQAWTRTQSGPPQVKMDKTKPLEAFDRQPTRPRTVP